MITIVMRRGGDGPRYLEFPEADFLTIQLTDYVLLRRRSVTGPKSAPGDDVELVAALPRDMVERAEMAPLASVRLRDRDEALRSE